MDRRSSPMAGSTVTSDTPEAICLLEHWLCRALSVALTTHTAEQGDHNVLTCVNLYRGVYFLLRLCVCPSLPFVSPTSIVLAESPFLFYPMLSCSPSHPLLPMGLFTLGLAAHTSLSHQAERHRSQSYTELHQDIQAMQKGPVTEKRDVKKTTFLYPLEVQWMDVPG